MSEPSNAGAAPKKFQHIDDPNEARDLLKDAARSTAPVMIWTRDQVHTLSSHFLTLSEAERLFYCVTPDGFDTRKFNDDLHQRNSADCYFSLSLPVASLFFTAKFLGSNSGGLQFQIPDKIFRVQRRANFRLPVPAGYVVKVEFPDPLFSDKKFSKKAIDVSAGGFSLSVSEDEAEQFTVGMEVPDVVVQLKGRRITCVAVVRHISVLPTGGPNSGGKLGLQFKEISPADSQYVASYVMEESRKFLMTALSEFEG